MNNLSLLFKTLRKDISALFIVCLMTIFLIDFWLKGYVEWFSGGAKLGDIIYKLCLSYTSAFIFYFLVVHIKAQKDKTNINNYVIPKVERIISCCNELIAALAKSANVNLANKYPTDEELSIICLNINPHTAAPMMKSDFSGHINWVGFFDFYKRRSNETTDKIFVTMPHLDTELVNIIARIDDCSYFVLLDLIGPFTGRITDLTSFQAVLTDYFKLTKELEKYATEKLKHYKK